MIRFNSNSDAGKKDQISLRLYINMQITLHTSLFCKLINFNRCGVEIQLQSDGLFPDSRSTYQRFHCFLQALPSLDLKVKSLNRCHFCQNFHQLCLDFADIRVANQ